MRTVSAREFNQNPSAVMRAVDEGGEVVITSRGTPAYVMLRYDEHVARRAGRSLARGLAMSAPDDSDTARAIIDPSRVEL